MLQRRLAEAERVIAAQAAAIAHLESRLHSLELSSRPQSRVEVSHGCADCAPSKQGKHGTRSNSVEKIGLNIDNQ